MAMGEKGIRILLSYHRHDVEWRDSFDKQAEPFQEEGQLHISYNEVAEGSQSFGDYQEDLASFDVIFLCISTKYLSLSNFIEKEIPERILPLEERESRVIPVYLDHCSWQSISWGREMRLRPSPQLAFSDMSEDEKERHISKLIKDALVKLPRAEDAESTYGEGKYGEGAYGGVEKVVDDSNPVREYHVKLTRFLGGKKGYPNGSALVRGSRQDSGEYFSDIELKDAESKQWLGVIEVNATKEGELYVREESELVERAERLGLPLYMLGPAVLDPSDEYEVLRLTEEGNLEQISMEDFPDYEDLRKKVGTKRQVSGGDDLRDDDWRKDFTRFLTEEKKWLKISFANENYKNMAVDLSIRHPESKKLIGLINFEEKIDRKIESKADASFAQFAELEIGKILVTPSTEKSNYSFAIYKYSDRGLVRMQPEDFPAYEKREPKTPDKKLTLSNFKVGLLSDEIEICDKVITIAVRLNGLEHYVAHESYVDLELKSFNRVVAQLHRYGENETKIALAIVGVNKGMKQKESQFNESIVRGEIAELSGYKKGPPGERAWLNGNQPKIGAREKASVYVIEPEILENPDVGNEVNELLKLAKEYVQGRGPISEAEDLGPYHAPIAAFSGDGVRDGEGRLVDQLDIKAEVNAMSSLIAARDIKWPLSIGLFGDWGRGKSFFMEMMYNRIKKTSEESRKWVGAGNESAYCTNVVQIRFNAWHYMDANLWASLVTHIFEELARQMSGDEEEDLARTKEKIFGQLESAKELKKEAQEKKRKAAELRKEAEDKLGKAEKERADAAQELANLTGQDVVALAKEDPRIREEFAKIAGTLGLDKIAPAADDLREVVSQGRDLFGRVSLIWRTISSRRKGKIKLLVVIGLILGLPVLVGLVAWWVSDSAFAAQLTGVIGMIGSVITGHMKAIKPRLARINKGLAQWEKTQEEILKISAEKTQQRNEEELRIWREIENLKERERAAEADVERAEGLEDEASKELEEIKTGRRLFRFIEERSRKSEYKEKLGIIALIREDFELLSKLVSKSSEETGGDDLPRVDRIVLYIDDLDRCPSERVVEVLQAVHLILAFELFVVVVAVDSRWILHALYEEYSAFGGVDKATARLGSRWLTTPQNYVEKIFQIPFALRPMGDRGYRQLVGKLVESEKRADRESMVEEQEVMAREGREEQELEREIPQREEKEIRMDEFKPTIEMKPPSANLSEQEAEFMKAMGDLIPSPRAAKRFVNIYRLTLASVDDRRRLSELRGAENRPGEYQAVLLMLAILTGFPRQGADILKVLANGGGKCNGILDFVSKLKTRKEPNSEPARYRNGVRKGILEAERVVWDRLRNILKERIEELGVRDSLEPFVRWAGWVARFSFQYKPVISEEEGAEEDG